MASVLETGGNFPEYLVTELFNKVKGKSSLATLCGATPVKFNGMKEFTFTMDKEVDIVAESGKKSVGGATLTPVTIVPVKFEYSARVSDEFLYATEEVQIDILKDFNEGFARKLTRGFDIAAMHGINPRSGEASTVVGDNNFDSLITQTVTDSEDNADAQVESAISLVQGNEIDVTGFAMAPSLCSDLAKLTYDNGVKMYPDLAWGNAPSSLNGLAVSVNPTVSAASSGDLGIVGDFQGAFKWGYAKDVMTKIIEYGNPDNDEDLGDLQGRNQILIRAEAYLGWGILDSEAFAIINATASEA